MTKYAFSYDGQDWNNGLYETRNIAIIVAVNSYQKAIARDQDKPVGSVKFYLGKAHVEPLPDIDSQFIIQDLRQKLKNKVGDVGASWFDDSYQEVFDRSINATIKNFVRELKQEPKFFSVYDVEEYSHDGSPVATLKDLHTVLEGLTDNAKVAGTAHKDDLLERWRFLKEQLGATLKDLNQVVPSNGFEATMQICQWDGLDIPEDKWEIIESLVIAYYSELIDLQDQIVALQTELTKQASQENKSS